MEQYQISLNNKPNIVYTISYNEIDHVLFIFYVLQDDKCFV